MTKMRLLQTCIVVLCTSVLNAAESPSIIKELAHLVVKKPTSSVKGQISLKANDSDCRVFTATVDLVQNGGKASATKSEIFLQGAKATITGKVCLPAKGEPYELRVNLSHDGNITVGGSEVIFNGPVRKTGTPIFRVDESAKVIEIESDDKEPLVFKITAEGFAFESGSGKIKTPDGKVHILKNQ